MKKIVIKIGRSIATSKRNKIDRFLFEQLAKQIKQLHENNMAVVLVVSAAVCSGEQALGLKGTYSVSKQLVGGVGQAIVIAELITIFQKHDLKIAQLLMTRHDLEDEQKSCGIVTVIAHAAKEGIVLIVNENDIVELHSFHGNDFLATEVAKLARADHLLLLTDVEGVINTEKAVITHYKKNHEIAHVTKSGFRGEVGGIKGKIEAALSAAESGITTWISHGKTKDILTRMFLHNEHIGTKILGGIV